MKLPELKRKFRNKYTIRITAGVLTVALFGSGMTAVAVQADTRSGAFKTAAELDLAENSANMAENEGNENIVAYGRETGREAAAGEQANDGVEETEKDTDSTLSDQFSVEVNDKEIGKEESVYLLSDADGTVHDTIVSDHLINNEKKDILSDNSTLTDIKNVKGDEAFSQNGDVLTWQADGKDIFYQGKSKEAAPVSQKVTYYLDGEEISPEELAGKSGTVTIHFDYTNNSSFEETIDGEKHRVKVPFAAVTAMVLDDHFSNIRVKNGKLENNGDRTVVMGYALPGISDSLEGLDSDFSDDLDLPEDFEVTADVEDFKLDTVMTIVANAGSLISVKGDTSSMDQMVSDLQDASSELRKGSKDLANGMDSFQKGLADYASGMGELYSKSGDLGEGVNTLNKSAASINKGIQSLDKGLKKEMSHKEQKEVQKNAAAAVKKEFQNGKTKEVADQIYSSLRYQKNKDGSTVDGQLYSSLYDGAYSANAAQTVYKEVVRQVLLSAAGQPADSKLTVDQVAAGIKDAYAKGAQAQDPTATAMYAVTDGMTPAQLAELLYAKSGAKDTLFSKTENSIQTQLAAGRNNGQVSSAVEKSLRSLSQQLAAACENAASQAAGSAAITGAESAKAAIVKQIEAVQSNGYSLVTGSAALSKGTRSLADQVPQLTKGITALNEAAAKLVQGADKLGNGSHDLSDGMLEFDEEGIGKIVDSYNGDIKPLTGRLQAMLDAGEDYQTFTGLSDGVNGSVKFIYKLDSIKTGEKES